MSNYQTFFSFLVLESGKFVGTLGSGSGTCSVFQPFIFIFGQCVTSSFSIYRLACKKYMDWGQIEKLQSQFFFVAKYVIGVFPFFPGRVLLIHFNQDTKKNISITKTENICSSKIIYFQTKITTFYGCSN